MKDVIVASALAFVTIAPAAAQAIADNTPVRVVPSGAGNGAWVTGKVVRNKGSGCTMVALNSVGKMERQDKGAWVDVPVKPLLASETKSCREADND